MRCISVRVCVRRNPLNRLQFRFMFLLLALMALTAISGLACPTPFDVLRARTESLGETLYVRASWRDPWMNIVPRDVYPLGAGYVRSVFEIQRSEPGSDEENWPAIQSIANNPGGGACAGTATQAYVGMTEQTYAPEGFKLKGPLICQADLAMYWHSQEFWEKYFQALEKRTRKSVINRIGNVYRTYVPKASANANFHSIPGTLNIQPAGQFVPMAGLNGANIPTSELTQEMLDTVAIELMEEGADEPNSNGWITQGPDGPLFPLLIGPDMSQRLLTNNAELRSDLNQSFQGWGEANPVIKRMGASRTIKNFRHMITRFPARWTSGTMTVGTPTTASRVNAGTLNAANPLLRVPTFLVSPIVAGGKGYSVTVNPDWRDPALANYEGADVLNPWVMTEELIKPVNSAPGMKWHPQNYFGEWQFVTGNDAVLGEADCTGITDPLHEQGRHFAQYKHAFKPVFTNYGRMLLFARCANGYSTVQCS